MNTAYVLVAIGQQSRLWEQGQKAAESVHTEFSNETSGIFWSELVSWSMSAFSYCIYLKDAFIFCLLDIFIFFNPASYTSFLKCEFFSLLLTLRKIPLTWNKMREILRTILKVSQYYVQEWILNQDQDANLKDLNKS